jgi:lysophospholipase L1-like esterase
MTVSRALRTIGGFLGTLMVLGGLVSALRGSLGRIETLGIGLGLVILVFAMLGPRSGRAYRGLALILLNSVVVLVVIELGAGAVMTVLSGDNPQAQPQAEGNTGPPAPAPQSSYYTAEPWGARYWKELSDVWFRAWYFPHELGRRGAYKGELINVSDEGLRLTPGAVCEPGVPRVFVLGGSTMWGYGAPDWGTIPAYLQAGWSRRGGRFCVINFGQLGHTSTQDLIVLERELQRCHVPDLVIFYDGVNDITLGRQWNLPGAHTDLYNVAERLEGRVKTPSRFESLATLRLVRHFLPRDSIPAPRYPGHTGPVDPGLGDGITEVYLNNVRMARALAREYGFQSFFFWQPMIWIGKKPLTEEERHLHAGMPPETRNRDEPLRTLLREVYANVGRAAVPGSGLFDISDVFDTTTALVYLDSHHLTHQGNRLVAERMLELVPTPAPRPTPRGTPACEAGTEASP